MDPIKIFSDQFSLKNKLYEIYNISRTFFLLFDLDHLKVAILLDKLFEIFGCENYL